MRLALCCLCAPGPTAGRPHPEAGSVIGPPLTPLQILDTVRNVHSGQLDWQVIGCERAAACGAEPAMMVNSWSVDELRAWTGAKG
jgi:hypothetical protein